MLLQETWLVKFVEFKDVCKIVAVRYNHINKLCFFPQHFSVYSRSYEISAAKTRRGTNDLLEQRPVLCRNPKRNWSQ